MEVRATKDQMRQQFRLLDEWVRIVQDGRPWKKAQSFRRAMGLRPGSYHLNSQVHKEPWATGRENMLIHFSLSNLPQPPAGPVLSGRQQTRSQHFVSWGSKLQLHSIFFSSHTNGQLQHCSILAYLFHDHRTLPKAWVFFLYLFMYLVRSGDFNSRMCRYYLPGCGSQL